MVADLRRQPRAEHHPNREVVLGDAAQHQLAVFAGAVQTHESKAARDQQTQVAQHLLATGAFRAGTAVRLLSCAIRRVRQGEYFTVEQSVAALPCLRIARECDRLTGLVRASHRRAAARGQHEANGDPRGSEAPRRRAWIIRRSNICMPHGNARHLLFV